MTDQLQISDQKICEDTPNAISLPELAGGHTPSPLLDGHQIDLFGPDPALANHSAVQESRKEKKTTGICGRCGSTLSVNPDRQSCLESKCHLQFSIIGGMMWPMIWKEKVKPRGRRLGQLVVSAHPISGTDCGLWLTPRANEVVEPAGQAAKRLGDRRPETACSLGEQVTNAALWPTPKHRDHHTEGKGKFSPSLPAKIHLMWPTPTTRDHKDGPFTPNVPINSLLGRQVWNGSTAQTENKGSLNPEFPCWLMGFPSEWLYSMVLAMQSYRRSRRLSSNRTKKEKNHDK